MWHGRSVSRSVSQMHRKPVNSASEKTPKDGTCRVVATPGRPAGSKSCASSVSRMFLPPWKMNPRRCEFASPARGLDWMHFRHSPAGPSVGAGVGFSFSQGEKMAARGAGAGSVAPTSNGGAPRNLFPPKIIQPAKTVGSRCREHTFTNPHHGGPGFQMLRWCTNAKATRHHPSS